MIKINVLTKKLKKSESNRKWRAANPEKHRESDRKWRAANLEKAREKARESMRKYRAANREKICAADRARRAANPEKAREKDRKWRAANLEKAREKVRESNRKCRAANLEKAREKDREKNRKWRAANLEKARESNRKWCAANPEKCRAKSHKRRCRIAGNGGTHTAEQFKALCAHFGNRCVCCGQLRKLEANHVISVKMNETFMLPLGFLNDIDNLQPLCRGCNNKKRSQWLRHKAFVDYRTCPHADCIAAA